MPAGQAPATEVCARPLGPEESPEPGDLHFAVGFSPQSAVVSRIIAAGTASRTNHVGVIAHVSGDEWQIIEALSDGVRCNAHAPPPLSTVMRLSDNAAVRADVVARAEEISARGIKYDWWTIGRIALVGFFGRVPFLTLPLLSWPWLARWIGPAWGAPLIVVVATVVLYKARPALFAVAMVLPWPDPSHRMICSEFTRHVIEASFGEHSLPGLQAVKPSMTAPGDLLQALLGRSDYSTNPIGDARAVMDYTRRLPQTPR